MKNLFIFGMSAAFLSILCIAHPLTGTANAQARGDYERNAVCKKMRRSGTLRWYSIASGIARGGAGRYGLTGFVTKACHTNENSCRRWLANIYREIPNIETLEIAYCKRVRRS